MHRSLEPFPRGIWVKRSQVSEITIQNIAKLSNLKIQVGGGIRSIQRIKNLISLGVDRVIVGTAAIEK